MKLYVGNLHHSITDTGLNDIFSSVGEVTRAKVVTDHYTRQSKGFGYVEMPVNEEGALAIQMMNGMMINDRPLVVNMARSRDKRLGNGW